MLHTERANAKELSFDGLDSGIMVSTAGAKGAGRAQTIQLFHGSCAKRRDRERDRDQYGRIVAVCHIAGLRGPDVNAMMVAEGWALAYRRFSSDYVKFENGARKNGNGSRQPCGYGGSRGCQGHHRGQKH